MKTLRLTTSLARHACNPFATRHTRPGAIPPLDATGRPRDLVALLAAADRLGGSAAISGPHGTGKSTLLAALGDALADRGEQISSVRVHRCDGLRTVTEALSGLPAGGTLCLDSWNELSGPASILVLLRARLRRVRLLVTSHHTRLLPVVLRTEGTLPLLAAIVRRLPPTADLVTNADLAAAFARHKGNLRESLADLYDLVEDRRRH